MIIPEEEGEGIIPEETGAGTTVVIATRDGEDVGIRVTLVTGGRRGVGEGCPADDGG
jgi:hypothetical protein